jgi:DNA invertase Pin-like site-specific DNA recombinase
MEQRALLDAYVRAFAVDPVTTRPATSIAPEPTSGKRLGRPVTAACKQPQVLKLFAKGISKAEIARRLAIGRTSVRRVLATGKA